MSKQYFPGFTKEDEEKLENERRALAAAAEQLAKEKAFERSVHKIAHPAALNIAGRAGFFTFMTAQVVGFLMACSLWGAGESFDSDCIKNGRHIGTQKSVPFREMVREYVDYNYIAQGGEFYLDNNGQCLHRDSNKTFPDLRLITALGMIAALLVSLPKYGRNKKELDEIVRHMFYLRDGLRFNDSADATTALYKKHAKFIRQISGQNGDYFNAVIDPNSPIYSDTNPLLLEMILAGHLKKYPMDWTFVEDKFNEISLPATLTKKYTKTR